MGDYYKWSLVIIERPGSHRTSDEAQENRDNAAAQPPLTRTDLKYEDETRHFSITKQPVRRIRAINEQFRIKTLENEISTSFSRFTYSYRSRSSRPQIARISRKDRPWSGSRLSVLLPCTMRSVADKLNTAAGSEVGVILWPYTQIWELARALEKHQERLLILERRGLCDP